MITVGERHLTEPNDTWWEVHVFDGDEQLAVMQGSVVESANVTDPSGGIGAARLLLKLPDEQSMGCVAQGRHLRLVVGSAVGPEPVCLFKGRVDYVETRRENPAEHFQLEVHARAAGSQLLDEGFRGEADGSLDEIVKTLCQLEPVVEVAEAPNLGRLRVWTDAGSAWGALQLLAASARSVIMGEGHDRFVLSTREAAFARMDRKPVQVIDASKAKNVTFREGVPVRGISDDEDGD